MMELTLPTDLVAERALLGSLLLERDAIVVVAPMVEADDFSLLKHAYIYEAIVSLYRRRVPPDLITVTTELTANERIAQVGGLAALSDLAMSVPTAIHADHYAAAVRRCATLRRLIRAGGQIAAAGYEPNADPAAALNQARAELDRVAPMSDGAFTPLAKILEGLLDELSVPASERNQRVSTGLADVDEMLGGLYGGELTILAARPGVGKSALALTIANAVAAQGGKVGIFSLEMGKRELARRLLAMRTGHNVSDLRARDLSETALREVLGAMADLSPLPLAVDDTPALQLATLRHRALAYAHRGGCDLLIVDYLQLVRGSGENRVQEVSQVARTLKDLSRELDAPVLALSQLSRAVESRQSKIPQLSDLRESGELEQAADVVLFLYREELYDKETDQKGIAELHIAKHRNGPLGVAVLRFDARTTSFRALERYRAPEGY